MNKQETACRIPLPIRCPPLFRRRNSAAGRLGQIVPKPLSSITFSPLSRRFSAAERRFLPGVRDMRRGRSIPPTPPLERLSSPGYAAMLWV